MVQLQEDAMKRFIIFDVIGKAVFRPGFVKIEY